MRRLVVPVVLGLVTLALSAASIQRADGTRACNPDRVSGVDDPSLRRVAEDWREAYNAGDAPRVAALYTEEGQYLSAHVGARGREAIRAYFQRGIDAGGRIEAIRVLESRSDGTLAYATGTYEANNAGQKVDGRILLVLEKCGDRWFIAAHEFVVRDQP